MTFLETLNGQPDCVLGVSTAWLPTSALDLVFFDHPLMSWVGANTPYVADSKSYADYSKYYMGGSQSYVSVNKFYVVVSKSYVGDI